jgi:hypothetical protein
MRGFIILVLLFFQQLSAQQLKVLHKVELDLNVSETSGLIYIGGMLWTINDSGGQPEIYQVDSASGKILKTIRVSNAKNTDWEDITTDKKYIYIGDTGNNKGKRNKGVIYKIPADIIYTAQTIISVTADSITFEFPDYSYQHKTPHDFDCESIFTYQEHLILITKNRKNNHAFVYKIPNKKGHYIAEYLNTISSKGMVTGADINSNGKLVVVSYTRDLLFCFIDMYSIESVFSKTMANPTVSYTLPSLDWGQVESVSWMNNNIALTNEAIKKINFPAFLKIIKPF